MALPFPEQAGLRSSQTGPRVVQVILSEALRGTGITESPYRTVTQVHTFEGELIAERDTALEAVTGTGWWAHGVQARAAELIGTLQRQVEDAHAVAKSVVDQAAQERERDRDVVERGIGQVLGHLEALLFRAAPLTKADKKHGHLPRLEPFCLLCESEGGVHYEHCALWNAIKVLNHIRARFELSLAG